MTILERSFPNREHLRCYLHGEFPKAAKRSPHPAPILGGRKAALAALADIRPEEYGAKRNFLGGAASKLSAYIRHGVVSLAEVRDFAVSSVLRKKEVEPFVTRLAWRDYWLRASAARRGKIWEDLEQPKTGVAPKEYSRDLPVDIQTGTTGLACIDAFSRELRTTGYLHNHARMWLASYVVHWRRVRWQAGARWFHEHLLDGDPASNPLSWQWVAGTFSNRPYIFNREELELYSGGQFCARCPQRGSCSVDGSHQELSRRLFPAASVRSEPEMTVGV